MNKRKVLTSVFLTAMICGFVAESQAQDCEFPPKELTHGPHREYRGLYENITYGYSVVIPMNLVGYDDENPFYQHGFGMILEPEPHSYIVVDGDKNSLEFARPFDAASRFLQYLSRRGGKVESSSITVSQLGQLKAARLVATFTCPGTTGQYVRASMVAISPDKDFLYEVTLYSRFDRFALDRATLDALVKSWKHLRK